MADFEGSGARGDAVDEAWPAERIADELQRMRFDAGDVSFGEIAARISRRRHDRGLSEAASRIARSTVYDVFRPGRSRLNPGLVAEIVVALGGDDAEAERWRTRSQRGRSAAVHRAAAVDAQSLPPLPEDHGPAPRSLESDSPPADGDPPALVPLFRFDGSSAPERRIAARAGVAILIVMLCVAVNMVGGRTILLFTLPLYLDMIGTAIAAIALGPWYGVAVAIGTHAVGAVFDQSLVGVPYTLVNITGAFVWAYGVRRWGLGRSPLRFFALNMIVAVSCTAVSVPMTLIFHHGLTTHVANEAMAHKLMVLGGTLAVSLFSSNILTSILDKLITGFIALAVAPLLLEWLDGWRRTGRARPVLFMRREPGSRPLRV